MNNIQNKSIPFSIGKTTNINNQLSMGEYLNYIKYQSVRQPIFKLELVNKTDETPYKSIEDSMVNSDGSLNVSLNNGVHRTCSFTLVNYENKYTSTFANLSIGSKFSLSLGYLINNTPYYFKHGVFVFDSPSLVSNPTNKIISINATDKWSMVNGTNGGVFQATYKVEKGSKLKSIVEKTLSLDVVYDPIKPNIDNSLNDFTMPYDIIKEAGSTVSDLLLEVVGTANAYIYYDINGICTVKPYEYDEDKAPIHHFNQDDINFIDAQKTYIYDNLFNAVFVIADNLQNDAVPIYAESLNNNPSDPNSIPNIGYKKYKPITENIKGITTQSLAEQRCRYELKIVASRQSSISINARSMYHLLENQIILLTDRYVDASTERFLINGYTLPISTDGTMSINASKAMGYI